EVGASRLALDRDALDREVGLRGQHLLDQPLNLDRRYVACGADPGGIAVAVKSSNVSLERLGGSRPREQFLQLREPHDHEMTSALHPPDAVLDIARRLEGAGYEAWCVGGAVRDAILGHP